MAWRPHSPSTLAVGCLHAICLWHLNLAPGRCLPMFLRTERCVVHARVPLQGPEATDEDFAWQQYPLFHIPCFRTVALVSHPLFQDSHSCFTSLVSGQSPLFHIPCCRPVTHSSEARPHASFCPVSGRTAGRSCWGPVNTSLLVHAARLTRKQPAVQLCRLCKGFGGAAAGCAGL